MHKTFLRLLTPAVLIAAIFAAGAAHSADEKPPYDKADALQTIINPHDQVNDEGEILWGRCVICHVNVPDIEKERSIKDVKLRFKEELKDLCFRCHPTKRHPGAEGGISARMSGYAAKDHLVVPRTDILLNMRFTKKEVFTSIPLDPDTGKVTCATCHNPHERGVLFGRGDWGADSAMRLRTEGLDICQYCHRK